MGLVFSAHLDILPAPSRSSANSFAFPCSSELIFGVLTFHAEVAPYGLLNRTRIPFPDRLECYFFPH